MLRLSSGLGVLVCAVRFGAGLDGQQDLNGNVTTFENLFFNAVWSSTSLRGIAQPYREAGASKG